MKTSSSDNLNKFEQFHRGDGGTDNPNNETVEMIQTVFGDGESIR